MLLGSYIILILMVSTFKGKKTWILTDLLSCRLCYTAPEGEDHCPPMPKDVVARLASMYARIVEELVWCNQSTLYICLQKGGGGSHDVGDYSLVKVGALAKSKSAETVMGLPHV
jgi:hypothetical protein